MLKGKKEKITYKSGLVPSKRGLLIHPKLKATGYTNVPTMVHKGKAINGTSSCMAYIG
jgi:hypothetical protein